MQPNHLVFNRGALRLVISFTSYSVTASLYAPNLRDSLAYANATIRQCIRIEAGDKEEGTQPSLWLEGAAFYLRVNEVDRVRDALQQWRVLPAKVVP